MVWDIEKIKGETNSPHVHILVLEILQIFRCDKVYVVKVYFNILFWNYYRLTASCKSTT